MDSNNMKTCPICELSSKIPLKHSSLVQTEICGDCDYLIGLGFSNFDKQPPSYLYPATWVYNRIEKITGLSL